MTAKQRFVFTVHQSEQAQSALRLTRSALWKDYTREYVFEQHRLFGEALEKRVPLDPPLWRSCSPDKKVLKIGYISPDFYRHSVSYFIHAPLKHHDPAFVHVTCYSDVASEDDKTQLFKSLVIRPPGYCPRNLLCEHGD